MNQTPGASIGPCGFCSQGQLHIFRCPRCSAVVAVCDECELVWDDVAGVHADPALPSDSAFPLCPRCGSHEGNWERLSHAAIRRAGLANLLVKPKEG